MTLLIDLALASARVSNDSEPEDSLVKSDFLHTPGTYAFSKHGIISNIALSTQPC